MNKGDRIDFTYYRSGGSMKKFVTMFMVLALASLALADTHVKGYTRKDGTYVPGHYRSDPDGNKANNWSTKGNVNPYTGKEGTRTYGGQYGGSSSNGTTERSSSCRTVYVSGGYDSYGTYQAGRYMTVCD
jgi:hypothetical protein